MKNRMRESRSFGSVRVAPWSATGPVAWDGRRGKA